MCALCPADLLPAIPGSHPIPGWGRWEGITPLLHQGCPKARGRSTGGPRAACGTTLCQNSQSQFHVSALPSRGHKARADRLGWLHFHGRLPGCGPVCPGSPVPSCEFPGASTEEPLLSALSLTSTNTLTRLSACSGRAVDIWSKSRRNIPFR